MTKREANPISFCKTIFVRLAELHRGQVITTEKATLRAVCVGVADGVENGTNNARSKPNSSCSHAESATNRSSQPTDPLREKGMTEHNRDLRSSIDSAPLFKTTMQCPSLRIITPNTPPKALSPQGKYYGRHHNGNNDSRIEEHSKVPKPETKTNHTTKTTRTNRPPGCPKEQLRW